MNTLFVSHLPTSVGHGVSHRFVQLVTFAWAAPLMVRLNDELKVRAAISELKQMSDRELDDIGIARKDISRAVRGR
jgi:uncharacterized protein YjiS (DUF1127 family)